MDFSSGGRLLPLGVDSIALRIGFSICGMFSFRFRWIPFNESDYTLARSHIRAVYTAAHEMWNKMFKTKNKQFFDELTKPKYMNISTKRKKTTTTRQKENKCPIADIYVNRWLRPSKIEINIFSVFFTFFILCFEKLTIRQHRGTAAYKES